MKILPSTRQNQQLRTPGKPELPHVKTTCLLQIFLAQEPLQANLADQIIVLTLG